MKVNLVLLKVGGINKAFSLPSTVTIVGRRQDCDLCVPLMVISRRHCALNMDDGVLSIRDLGSSNGTFVNGERIEEVDLVPGDRVAIGPLNFVVQIDGVPAEIVGDESVAARPEGRAKVNTEGGDLIAAPDSPVQPDMNNTEIINITDE
ncbi:MAG: FHA domain-containing protein [Planctomycetes bacterium]|nr:FHA domain-containing protein [Planctomycetota bacterium]